jgi:hypothetical protein
MMDLFPHNVASQPRRNTIDGARRAVCSNVFMVVLSDANRHLEDAVYVDLDGSGWNVVELHSPVAVGVIL